MKLLRTLAVGCVLGMALHASAVHVFWLLGLSLDGLVRPLLGFVLTLVACSLVHRCADPVGLGAASDDGARWERVARFAFVALLLAVFVPLFWGCLAPAREWDGWASWDFRARHLARDGGIAQAFFSDPGVYSPARGYPLALPLFVADAMRLLGNPQGRVVHLVFFALLLALSHVLLRARGLASRHALLGTSVLLCMPCWIGPGAGSVDSGYADLPLALCLMGSSAALLASADDAKLGVLACASIALLPLVKPEGLLYGALLLLFSMRLVPIARYRKMALVLALAAALGGLLRARLLGSQVLPVAALSAVPLLILGMRIYLDAREARTRSPLGFWQRLAWVCVLLVISAFAIVVSGGPLATALQGAGERISGRASVVLELSWGVLRCLVEPRDFALVWPLFFVAFARSKAPGAGLRSLALLVTAGLVLCVGALLIVPEADLAHELRSRFGRLVSHWVAPAWCCVCLGLFRPGVPSARDGHAPPAVEA